MIFNYKNKIDEIIRKKYEEILEQEKKHLRQTIVENIIKGKKFTIYNLQMQKPGFYRWNYKKALVDIIKYLKKNNFRPFFRFPNRILIIHDEYSLDKKYDENDDDIIFLRNENNRTLKEFLNKN
jgi:hypothetical protein